MSDDAIALLRRQIAQMEQEPGSGPRTVEAPDDGRGSGDGPITNPAFRKLIDLVNVSDRSESYLRERLSRYDFAPEDIEDAISRGRRFGYVDDLRFADVLIRSRVAQGKGSAGIERELKSHGINVYDVAGWPEEYGISEEDQVERALAVLARTPPRSKNIRESAYQKLMRKGFPSTVASTAARRFCDRQIPTE